MKQLLIIVFCSWIGAQSVQFNEIMSSNGATIYDEDGDTPDWIELYNSGDNNINLNGHGITDDPSDPFKWVFPNIEISPQDYILLFASEKDRREWVPHWE
ncbi:MAG TPA: hypothetical protein DEA65_00515, partial [Candidatus Marinimicrobia bacterium]|nr:hypothetical protein [Candidatus Neomarinimicrobiota bacterium]